MIIVKKTK